MSKGSPTFLKSNFDKFGIGLSRVMVDGLLVQWLLHGAPYLVARYEQLGDVEDGKLPYVTLQACLQQHLSYYSSFCAMICASPGLSPFALRCSDTRVRAFLTNARRVFVSSSPAVATVIHTARDTSDHTQATPITPNHT